MMTNTDAKFWSFRYSGGLDQERFVEFEKAVSDLKEIQYVDANLIRFHEATSPACNLQIRKRNFLSLLIESVRDYTNSTVHFLPVQMESELSEALPWEDIRKYYNRKFARESAYEQLFSGK